MDNKILCSDCQKKFSSVSARNRHIREIHGKSIDKKSNILCPLCQQEDKHPLENHGVLLKHLTSIHEVSIKQTNLTFRDYEEFEIWRQKETTHVNYVCERKTKAINGDEFVYYTCNRSNWRGYVSNCSKRTIQVGQSIKISGVCPSRIVVKILKQGTVNVNFTETHVGHEEELRTRRLMKEEEKLIVEKLSVGISHDRILQDVRKIEGTELQRISLVTRKDLNNLVRKYNIDKKRDANDMVATALKVEEWNSDGKNYAFLFNKIGKGVGNMLSKRLSQN